jgi:hypothetical protein
VQATRLSQRTWRTPTPHHQDRGRARRHPHEEPAKRVTWLTVRIFKNRRHHHVAFKVTFKVRPGVTLDRSGQRVTFEHDTGDPITPLCCAGGSISADQGQVDGRVEGRDLDVTGQTGLAHPTGYKVGPVSP